MDQPASAPDMTKSVDISAIFASIAKTKRQIGNQRALIADRAAEGKPVQSLEPLLDQMEDNLTLLQKVRRFLDARDRRMAERE
jgi:hypothetical protein